MMRETSSMKIKVVFLIGLLVFDAMSLPEHDLHSFDLPSFAEMFHPEQVPNNPSMPSRPSQSRAKHLRPKNPIIR